MIDPGGPVTHHSDFQSETIVKKKVVPYFTAAEKRAMAHYVALFPNTAVDTASEDAIGYFLKLADSIRDERVMALLRPQNG